MGNDSSNHQYIVMTRENEVSFGNSRQKASFSEVTALVKKMMTENLSIEDKMQVLQSYKKISKGFESKKFNFIYRFFFKSRIESLKAESKEIITSAKDQLLSYKIQQFKIHMEGNAAPTAQTEMLAFLYKNYLNGMIRKEIFLMSIDHLNLTPSEQVKAKKFLEIQGKVEKFKEILGEKGNKYSSSTTDLSALYRSCLQNGTNKEELFASLKARKIPADVQKKIMKFVESKEGQPLSKQSLETSVRILPPTNISPAGNVNLAPTKAVRHTSTADSIASIYANKSQLRQVDDAHLYLKLSAVGGAGTVATTVYELYKNLPNCKIGAMLAANSGAPGGKVGQELENNHVISKKQLNYKVQEESVIANVLMTMYGSDVDKQKEFINNTIQDQWGMEAPYDFKKNPADNNNMTRQGYDFSKREAKGKSAEKYNQAYVVDNCGISNLEREADGVTIGDKACPVTLVFADSVNANADLGNTGGTMKRTFNPNAAENYDEFRECVKNKLRAALDASASAGVTIPLVALLSGGIYAGNHAVEIKNDYANILKEVLSESVGPDKEPRGSYFYEVIIPDLA